MAAAGEVIKATNRDPAERCVTTTEKLPRPPPTRMPPPAPSGWLLPTQPSWTASRNTIGPTPHACESAPLLPNCHIGPVDPPRPVAGPAQKAPSTARPQSPG